MDDVSKYETDFYGWATGQAGLLRTRRLSEADSTFPVTCPYSFEQVSDEQL